MNSKEVNKNKQQPVIGTWIYDDELGWININLFLNKVKKIEEEINRKLQKTG